MDTILANMPYVSLTVHGSGQTDASGQDRQRFRENVAQLHGTDCDMITGSHEEIQACHIIAASALVNPADYGLESLWDARNGLILSQGNHTAFDKGHFTIVCDDESLKVFVFDLTLDHLHHATVDARDVSIATLRRHNKDAYVTAKASQWADQERLREFDDLVVTSKYSSDDESRIHKHRIIAVRQWLADTASSGRGRGNSRFRGRSCRERNRTRSRR